MKTKTKHFSPGSHYEPGLKVPEPALPAVPTWTAISPGSFATGTKGWGPLIPLC
jgi:hypothetical protein